MIDRKMISEQNEKDSINCRKNQTNPTLIALGNPDRGKERVS